MSEAPAAVEKSLVEKYTDKLKDASKRLPPDVRDVLVDYLVPVLEAMGAEYVGGFELLSENLEQVEAQSGSDLGFTKRVMHVVMALGATLDKALQMAGWSGPDGSPLAACPDELKVAFGGAQSLAGALAAEIKEMETDDDDDDGDDGDDGDAAAG